MKVAADSIILSPTDLSASLGCRHRTGLDLAAATGELARPYFHDPFLDLLRERGDAHERQFVERLRAQGLQVVDLRHASDRVTATLDAMRNGIDVIVQGSLADGNWRGYPDVLRRVATPSHLGDWSYEAWDTKLARNTKAGTILQLSAYSELLARAQDRMPEHFHVVTPDPERGIETYRVDDYAAYFRMTRRQLELAVAAGAGAVLAQHYPEPVEQCQVCEWRTRCDDRRRRDDHLSLVAGASRLHRRELEARGFSSLGHVAAMPVPLPFKPDRGSRAVYERLRDQAALQERRRRTGELALTRLPIVEGQGLCRLPRPDTGDLFLDLEGDAYAREGGREYLFGLGTFLDGRFEYRHWWAHTDAEERLAFEAVVDSIIAAWDAHPGMHVFHFGHYEASAFKRLMGRYATREAEIDRLLRGERFVDLYAVVRHAVRAAVESYSIKELEPFYGFTRSVPLDQAGHDRRVVELALESQAPATIPDAARRAVEAYNADDVRSTAALREWLEQLRDDAIAAGQDVPRPVTPDDAAPEQVTGLEQQVKERRQRLLDGVAADAAARTPAQTARWLLAWLLDWHRREFKAQLWEYYRLRDLPEEELLDEAKALAELRHVSAITQVKRSVVHRYTFPVQENDIRVSERLKLKDGGSVGTVEAIDRAARTIDIRQGPKQADVRPTAVFATETFNPDTMQQSLLRLADEILADPDLESAASDLLHRRPPRLRRGLFTPQAGETESEFAVRIVGDLDRTVLAIQGPPGAGKTFTGARMICALVAAGKRVGVTAVSHRVIDNLLAAVLREAGKLGVAVTAIHKTDPDDEVPEGVEPIADNKTVFARLAGGTANVAGGTSWLWARPEAAGTLDVLFVDEAGQMSLANVLAVAQAAQSIVLLGDPQQLEQPQKASHPDGTDVSALHHVLAGAKTIPADRGIFLHQTWRLPPAIAAFTSEAFYENRLRPRPGLDRQQLVGTDGFDGAGLWWVPVIHSGNENWSLEEIEAVDKVIERLTQGAWVDENKSARRLTPSDVLVVAPYNAHVTRLRERLERRGVRVGTVDKFQGQEAPVVIYTMAASSAADAPRGMEFLYRVNRLNVATSRARCAAILVASPRLLEAECRTGAADAARQRAVPLPRAGDHTNVCRRGIELGLAAPIGSQSQREDRDVERQRHPGAAGAGAAVHRPRAARCPLPAGNQGSHRPAAAVAV